MNLPRKIKDMNLFQDGESFLGENKVFTRPKLALATEDYRGGGLGAPIKIATGLQALECEHTYGGEIPAIKRRFGDPTLDGVQFRFAGAYQNEATGAYDDVQIIIRGRHEELDAGNDEPGSDTEFKVKTSCVYYKEMRNGETEIEVDILGRRFIVFGVDRWAEIRSIIGA